MPYMSLDGTSIVRSLSCVEKLRRNRRRYNRKSQKGIGTAACVRSDVEDVRLATACTLREFEKVWGSHMMMKDRFL